MPRLAKVKMKPTPAALKPDAGAVLNKAKAAFDEYRNKMTGASSGPGREGRAGKKRGFLPGGPVPMFPMPGWGAPPPYAPGSPWRGGAWPGAGAGPMPEPAAAAPLAESVGQMLRMGVAFATAAFTAGLQVMEGFAGTGLQSRWPMPYHQSEPECRCACGEGYVCGCECGCGCDSCCDEPDCCRVGVHNCDCCC
jgi:hypothetical protein